LSLNASLEGCLGVPGSLVTLAATREWATRRWWTFKEQAQLLLRCDRIAELILHDLGESFCHGCREVRPAVTPAPNLHATDTKKPRRLTIGFKRHPERERMLARRDVGLEAR